MEEVDVAAHGHYPAPHAYFEIADSVWNRQAASTHKRGVLAAFFIGILKKMICYDRRWGKVWILTVAAGNIIVKLAVGYWPLAIGY